MVGSIVRPASFCGVYGMKPSLGGINRLGSHDFMSQSSQGVLAASLADAWQVLTEIASRAGGDPGYPGLVGPALLPSARKPRRLAFLETTGWSLVSEPLKAQVAAGLDRLRKAGIEIVDRTSNADVEAAEKAITAALEMTRLINAWESRWPLNIYRERDASKLSPDMRARSEEAEALTQAQYRRALDKRAAIRATYAKLAQVADACITLTAVGAAPVGLSSTGNPAFAKDRLDRHGAVEPDIPSQVNHPHPAAAQFSDQFITILQNNARGERCLNSRELVRLLLPESRLAPLGHHERDREIFPRRRRPGLLRPRARRDGFGLANIDLSRGNLIFPLFEENRLRRLIARERLV